MMSKERAGKLIKNLSGISEYYSFRPSPLPPEPAIAIDNELNNLIINAHKMLAILDDRAEKIPDMNLFISMYVKKEALLSSQIEGTQATLEDIFEVNRDESINEDVEEVVNYVKAANYSIDRLNTLPLCNRLLLETHEILLSGVRGNEKNPGEFRHSQNWIGSKNSNITTARYIPPNIDDMKEALSDLEKFINDDSPYDALINAALVHYQFESIHPFLDGNGRIGRLLIVLYLLYKGTIKTPALYLSYYLKEHRIEYYDRMTAVRDSGNYEQWIKFFVRGIYISSKSAIESADKLIELKNSDEEKINSLDISERRKINIMKLYRHLLAKPIIDIKGASEELELAYNTVKSAVDVLMDLDIIKQDNNQERNKVFSYEAYLAVLREGTEIIL